jgi:hypothetical protein
MENYNQLQFYFNRNVKLSIPYKCSSRYIKETILDYPTFFIKKLFEDKYDNEYTLVEENNYVQYFGNPISIDFNIVDVNSLFENIYIYIFKYIYLKIYIYIYIYIYEFRFWVC